MTTTRTQHKPASIPIGGRFVSIDKIVDLFHAWGELLAASRRAKEAAANLLSLLPKTYRDLDRPIGLGGTPDPRQLARAAHKAGEDATAALDGLAGDDAPPIARNMLRLWDADE